MTSIDGYKQGTPGATYEIMGGGWETSAAGEPPTQETAPDSPGSITFEEADVATRRGVSYAGEVPDKIAPRAVSSFYPNHPA